MRVSWSKKRWIYLMGAILIGVAAILWGPNWFIDARLATHGVVVARKDDGKVGLVFKPDAGAGAFEYASRALHGCHISSVYLFGGSASNKSDGAGAAAFLRRFKTIESVHFMGYVLTEDMAQAVGSLPHVTLLEVRDAEKRGAIEWDQLFKTSSAIKIDGAVIDESVAKALQRAPHLKHLGIDGAPASRTAMDEVIDARPDVVIKEWPDTPAR